MAVYVRMTQVLVIVWVTTYAQPVVVVIDAVLSTVVDVTVGVAVPFMTMMRVVHSVQSVGWSSSTSTSSWIDLIGSVFTV